MSRKKHFFKSPPGASSLIWELALGMALKLYASVVKGLKLKVKKFWAIVCTFVEATGEKQNKIKSIYKLLLHFP